MKLFKRCVKCKKITEKGAYLEPPVVTKNAKGREVINPGIWLCKECAKEYFLDLSNDKHLTQQIRRVLKQHYF